jgi:archaellum component FlaG (FlaF/FlaG flagellin family)
MSHTITVIGRATSTVTTAQLMKGERAQRSIATNFQLINPPIKAPANMTGSQ